MASPLAAGRGIDAHVIHATSVAVSREHRRAKTDRIDTAMLQRGFLGWLRGERGHCSMAIVPTVAEEDGRCPYREREALVRVPTSTINRMKSILIQFFDMLRDPSTSHKVLFRAAVPALLKFQKIREKTAEFFTELDVSYPDSPLNDDQHRREPRPGEYIRDGALVRWSNLEPMRLYDALRGLHWTVLAFSGADSSTDAISDTHQWLSALIGQYGTDRLRALLIVGEPTAPSLVSETGGLTISIDAWRIVHDKHGAFDGALLLVRPDGYITLHRGASDRDRAVLEALVGRMLRSAS